MNSDTFRLFALGRLQRLRLAVASHLGCLWSICSALPVQVGELFQGMTSQQVLTSRSCFPSCCWLAHRLTATDLIDLAGKSRMQIHTSSHVVSSMFFFRWSNGVNHRNLNGKIRATLREFRSIADAVEEFKNVSGRYPTTQESLNALISRPRSIPPEQWEKALDSVPMDPWGRPYRYKLDAIDAGSYQLASNGPDRTEGTRDDMAVDFAGRIPVQKSQIDHPQGHIQGEHSNP